MGRWRVVLWPGFRWVLATLLRVLYGYRAEGGQHLPKQGPVILAGNHAGLFDTLMLMASSPRPIRFLAADVVFSWPGVGFLMRLAGTIPVNTQEARRNPTASLDVALSYLARGEVIGIFPEGKLTETGQMNKFHKGVVYLHQKSEAPLVPFALHGSFENWPLGRRLPHWPLRTALWLQWGQVLPFEPARQVPAVLKDFTRRVAFMKQAIVRRQAAVWLSNQRSVLAMVQQKADRWGSHLAVGNLTYIELSRQAHQASSALMTLTKRPVVRLALLADPGHEWVVGFFAANHTGAIILPLDPTWPDATLAEILAHATPEVLLTTAACAARAARLAETQMEASCLVASLGDGPNLPQGVAWLGALDVKTPLLGHDRDLLDDDFLWVYPPQGAPLRAIRLSFGNLLFQARTLEALMHLGPQDVVASTLPLSHLTALTCGLLSVLHAGGQLCPLPPSPEGLTAAVTEARATWLLTSPEVLTAVGSPLDGTQLRACVCTGPPMPADALAALEARLRLPVLQGYGCPETSPVITTNTLAARRPGSAGKPLPEVALEIRAADGNQVPPGGCGRIFTQGPHVMRGYWPPPSQGQSSPVDEAGWWDTGCYGWQDVEGFLWLTLPNQNDG